MSKRRERKLSSPEAKFYMEWAMNSLQKMKGDPYQDRSSFNEMLAKLESIMDKIKELNSDESEEVFSKYVH